MPRTTVQRAETFALTAGLVGLVADVISLWVFFSSGAAPGTSPGAQSFLFASTMYGWLLVSWMLVRIALTRKRARREPWHRIGEGELRKPAGYAVAGVGILLFPILHATLAVRLPITHPIFMGTHQFDVLQWTASIVVISGLMLAAIGYCVFLAILLLMPIVYRDIRAL